MKYKSTRSTDGILIDSAEAIKNGLAADGGLYMPQFIPTLTEEELESLIECPYAQRAAYIFAKYLTDYSINEVLSDATAAYSEKRFPGGAAPIRDIDGRVTSLELWHGPTCAFKDMALQIMPRLLSRALVKTEEKRTAFILVATSGDTGKAALEGYRDIPQIKIKVFYPIDGVSRVQKLQMQTQLGNNVDVVGIYGNFDDAQSGVKRIFGDADTARELDENGVFLSSANSINWGRLAPQIVYYVSAYCDMVAEGQISLGEKIDVCVPTGNFGNIFAAYLAKKMGLPIGKLICASNQNNVLTDFIQTGTYDRNRAFHTTASPSMDILISSNLERLLYLIAGSEKTAAYMAELAKTGRYTVSKEELAEIQESFAAFYASEEDCFAALKDAYDTHGYLMDTHTAVGYHAACTYAKEAEEKRRILLASTASPYKFASSVLFALTGKNEAGELEALDALSALTGTEIPAPLSHLDEKEVRFPAAIEAEAMKDSVLAFAKA
ncbi:MAG: threonine synthase [Clostridia bacterium]|nr:threonine synthase [Clostridia bacterium]